MLARTEVFKSCRCILKGENPIDQIVQPHFLLFQKFVKLFKIISGSNSDSPKLVISTVDGGR
jgi:hypothetical protein